MKKLILSLIVTITMIITAIPMFSVTSATQEGWYSFARQNITDEQLAEMVANGTIPHDTVVLTLRFNQISDISPLRELTNLQTLNISHNQINDITPLSVLDNLERLILSNNQISDIVPLKSLVNLIRLDLSDNNITDITPLVNLTNLGREAMGAGLSLSNNQITDLTGLENLTYLEMLTLSNNQITDVTPLQNLTNLWWLDLQNNQIDDVMPLAWLTGLDSSSLLLRGNPVADDAEQLTELRRARARNTDRTTLTLGHVLGTEPYTVDDAIEILRYVVGLPSVLDNCSVAMIAALVVSAEVPDVEDAIAILRDLVGLE